MIVALDAAASWMSYWVMPPTARWTNESLTSSRSSFWSALGERLERAGDVGLDDEVERGGLARLDLLEDVLEPGAGRTSRARRGRGSRPAASARGSRPPCGRLLVGRDHEVVAGVGDVGQAEHLDRRRRTRLLDLLALVVDQRPDPTPGRTGHERVADLERAALDEHGGDRAHDRCRGAPRARRRAPGRRGSPGGPRPRR